MASTCDSRWQQVVMPWLTGDMYSVTSGQDDPDSAHRCSPDTRLTDCTRSGWHSKKRPLWTESFRQELTYWGFQMRLHSAARQRVHQQQPLEFCFSRSGTGQKLSTAERRWFCKVHSRRKVCTKHLSVRCKNVKDRSLIGTPAEGYEETQQFLGTPLLANLHQPSR